MKHGVNVVKAQHSCVNKVVPRENVLCGTHFFIFGGDGMRLDMPCVETAHLLLRPVEEGDVCDMFAYYSDPLVMRYLSLHPHTDIEETLNSIRSYF